MDTPSPFWRLPRELRDMIYGFAFDSSQEKRLVQPQRRPVEQREIGADTETLIPRFRALMNDPVPPKISESERMQAGVNPGQRRKAAHTSSKTGPFQLRVNDKKRRKRRGALVVGQTDRLLQRSALDPLLTCKAFFTEAAPYFARSRTFVFRSMSDLQSFLCDWTGYKAAYGQHITSVALTCSGTGGLSHLAERCPQLQHLHIHFLSLQSPWLHPDIVNYSMAPESCVQIPSLHELCEIRGLESLGFEDAEKLAQRYYCSSCSAVHVASCGYWNLNIKTMAEYLRER